ncbi:MAG: Ig-like domain-containing protein [Clostridia bacterium]|nr:Ig-like domain-containing protein [Clostridia bacterium]
MKKYLYVVLLLLPVIIFGIVNMSSSVLARFIPVAVQSIEFEKQDVEGTVGGQEKLNVLFTPSRASNKNLRFVSSDNEVASVDSNGRVSFLQYGYAEITAISEDGNNEATCDISIRDPNDDPSEVKAIVLQYKENVHGEYLFGNKNSVGMSYKVYPKDTAVDDIEFVSENATITKNNGSAVIDFKKTGSIVVTARSVLTGANTSYTFKVNEGYNLTDKVELPVLKGWLNGVSDVYMLTDYKTDSSVFVRDVMLYGNDRRIDHSTMPNYDDKTYSKSDAGINLNRGTLKNLRVTGKVRDDMTLYDSVINVKVSEGIIENCLIENGRYNISTQGKSKAYDDGADIYIYNTKCIGASVASIQVNNSEEEGYKVKSTELFVRDIYFDYSNIGILVENSQSNMKDAVKGYSVVTVLPSEKGGSSIGVNNDNWLNIDSITGEAESMGFGYLVDEYRNHTEFVKKDRYGDYYVNCAILVAGGARNVSQVVLDDKTKLMLATVERAPRGLEAMEVGGSEKYTAYMVRAEFCNI